MAAGMNIRIDDSFAHITYEKNRVKYSKVLSVDTLVSSLVAQYGVKLPSLMPPGTRYYMKKGTQHYIFIEIPPVPRHIKYTNRGEKPIFDGVVPMPWSLLEIICSEEKEGSAYQVTGGSIFALKRPLLDDKDELFHFPAANVHSNHSICWGSTFSQLGGKFTSLAHVGRCVDYYFSSEFNTDIHPRLQRYSRYEDMLRGIQDQKTFDTSILTPSGTTFETLISRM